MAAANVTPARAFVAQRLNALQRGIAWELTFDQWWAVWDASGHWAERGRRQGNYVMSRPGDVGPYAPGNVKIATNRDNFIEAKGHGKKRDGTGVYCVLRGTAKPWVAKYGNKHIGYFATEAEGRTARADWSAANPGHADKKRVFSAEHREGLRRAATGRRLSDETRQKMGASIRAALAEKKTRTGSA